MAADAMRELRAREFGRLAAAGIAYLDYTGSGLYPESLVRRHAEWLCRHVVGNPHSQNPGAAVATAALEEARRRVLEFFRADPAEYVVAFTANATAALKLVGESYPFGPRSRLLLTADNHNSVNGIREFARARGAAVEYVPLDEELRAPELPARLAGADPSVPNLLAYPAQSNFSGVRHPLAWVALAREAGYDVLLDAAAYVPTSRLDLREVRPDFVALSFYKMFGYPTGVGALVARREALARLRRPWFSGGTVRFVSAQNRLHLLHPSAEAFEDGTPNFLAIAAVPAGLDFLEEVGLERIGAHVERLTARLLDALVALRHSNGAPLIELYGPRTLEARGGSVAFNVRDPAGRVVDRAVVEARAAAAGVALRTGCFCNPGAAEAAFRYGAVEAYRCFHALSPAEFTLQQFATCMDDKPVGAVRASLGIASDDSDVNRLIEVLAGFRDEAAAGAAPRRVPEVVEG